MNHGAVALLVFAACTSDPLFEEDTEVDGIIFKGPLVAGSEVSIQPVDGDLDPVGAATTAAVDADSGRYTARVANHGGVVRITASGSLWDEATKDTSTASQTLSAYALLEGESDTLHLNLLGDLSAARVQELVDGGTPVDDALQTAQTELVAALQLGGSTPTSSAGALDVYTANANAGWLLGASAVVSEAGVAHSDRVALMGELRADLADDGELEGLNITLLRDAEARVDPDHVVDRLRAYLEERGLSETLPNAGEALDSDGDGIPNTTDVCPYIADPGQETVAGGWGVACDTRIIDIDVSSDGYGCGLLAGSGEPVCWHLDAESPGGLPPRPDRYPTAQVGPWGDAPGLTGSFIWINMAPGVVCGQTETDSVSCWTAQTGGTLSIPGQATWVTTSSELICVRNPELTCYDHGGVELFSQPGDWITIETMGARRVCGITSESTLECFDDTGAADPFSAAPTTDIFGVRGLDDGPGGGAVVVVTGTSTLVGELAPLQDEAGNWIVYYVGPGMACGSAISGELLCAWDETICPNVDDPRPAQLNAGDFIIGAGGTCVVCSVESEDGFGECTPSVDER